jgi:phosphate transport system protein
MVAPKLGLGLGWGSGPHTVGSIGPNALSAGSRRPNGSSLRDVSELRRIFHQHLNTIEGKVIQLFAFVAEDLAVATNALLSGDVDALKVVTERETIINGLYHEVEDVVNNEMALQAPVATDLRLLLSVLRIVPELERSHDLVVHIAECATHILSDDLTPRCRGLVQRMADTADEMWNEATSAWYRRDRSAADRLDERDDDLDSLHSALMAELASGRMTLPVAMDMTLVGRYYERLGDHAVNIARRVVYLAGPEHDGNASPGVQTE